MAYHGITMTTTRTPRTVPLAAPLLALVAACGSSEESSTFASVRPDAAADAGEDAPLLHDAVPNPEAEQPDAPLPDMLTVRIRATNAAFAHTDGLSGQTPRTAAGGIRSFSLLRDQQDTNPAVIFEYGADVQEASFDDGGDTLVGAIVVSEVPAGHYTLARMVQAYSRYSISATLHDGSTATPGTLDNLIVMSDGTMVDGAQHDAGYYHYVFEAPGEPPVTFEGDDALVPAYSTTAGAVAVVENGQWAVYFPVNLDWSAGLQSAVDLVVTVNMFESFRWTDVALPGYQPGVFDFTATSYEPVVRFGGNEFATTVE